MSEPLAFTTEMLSVLLVLGLAVYLFVSEVVRVDVAAVIVLLVLGASGIVASDQLFGGFASMASSAFVFTKFLSLTRPIAGASSRLGTGGSFLTFVLVIVEAAAVGDRREAGSGSDGQRLDDDGQIPGGSWTAGGFANGRIAAFRDDGRRAGRFWQFRGAITHVRGACPRRSS